MMSDTGYNPDVTKLFDSYADTVYKIALVQMKNRSDADDIFQEVFLKLVQNTSKLQSEEHAKAWLIRVTINCCKKHYTSSWYKKTTELNEDITAPDELDDRYSGLYETVMKLPEQYRSVVHLFYYEGYSISEICMILKKKENTVKSHLFRARNMLKDELKGEIDFE